MSFYLVNWTHPNEKPSWPIDVAEAPISVAIGVFDGVHRGHRRLLEGVTDGGLGTPTVLTFVTNPALLTRPDSYLGELSSFEQRLDLFQKHGIRTVVAINFSPPFSNLRGAEFIELFQTFSPPVAHVVVGFNFHLGRNRDMHATEIQLLLEPQGIRVDIVPALKDNEEPISSSRIRHCIREGRLREAETLLGRPYELQVNGQFLPGEPLGIRKTQVLPENGTFAAKFISRQRVHEGSIEINKNGRIESDAPRIRWEKIQIFEKAD